MRGEGLMLLCGHSDVASGEDNFCREHHKQWPDDAGLRRIPIFAIDTAVEGTARGHVMKSRII
jgi:hypothetical protein